MDKSDKYIDDLFHQKFSGAGSVIPPSGSDWLQISKAIRKKNFLRFSPGSFNVFYLTAAAAAVTTVGSFILPDIIDNKKSETEPFVPVQVIDSLPDNDTLLERNDTTYIFKMEPANVNCNGQKSEIQLKNGKGANLNCLQTDEADNSENEIGVIQETVDSISKSQEINLIEKGGIINESNVQKEIAPADTIIKIDTIRIQKKGVQFKRKKDVF